MKFLTIPKSLLLAAACIIGFTNLSAQENSSTPQVETVATSDVESDASTSEVPAKGTDEKINEYLQPVSNEIFKYVFAGPDMEDSEGVGLTYRDGKKMTLPLILIWLAGSALLLTLIFKFVNIRELKLAFRTVRGKYSRSDDPGEITHFQALCAALSGTVGLGNISGVAIAISVGGAGAVFWMVLAGFLGMTVKFCECTLGVKYRKIDKNGNVLGGAMYYLRDGLAEKGMGGLGKAMAVLFAVVCVGASVGAGNMFQVNQATTQFIGITASAENKQASKDLATVGSEKESYLAFAKKLEAQQKSSENLRKELAEFNKKNDADAVVLSTKLAGVEAEIISLTAVVGEKGAKVKDFVTKEKALKEKVSSTEGFFAKKKWAFGLIVALVVGCVIIGGIKSIAKVTEFLVPIMCGIYVVAAVIVLCMFAGKIPAAFGTIFSSAFGMNAIAGGMIGAFIQGIRRASFSNEAGFGSAAIAHSAVKTRHPASEGLVALLEPLVDTIIVCTVTGLVIVVTGMHEVAGSDGIAKTSAAFEKGISWFPYILTAAVILFAISTMLSWSYYGEQAWSYLFGSSKVSGLLYKFIFCGFVVIGSAASLGSVIDFSDGLFFLMCLFNLAGVWMLYPVVRDELARYKKHVAEVDAGSSPEG